MKNEILTYLERRSDRHWLIGHDSQQLPHLTKELLVELSKFKLTEKRSPRILISETNPLQFLASFLAAVVAEADVFLGNPDWERQEWKQVFNLIQPDLVWGENVRWGEGKNGEREMGKTREKLQFPTSHSQSLIMIPTGGSSGKIRFAMHNWSTLSASVAGFCNYFACQQVHSCCVLPLYHVSGLMQFLRSFLTDGKLAIFPYPALKRGEKPEIEPQEFFISLVPTQLQFVLQSAPNWLSRFHTVLLGGAPAWRSLLDTARKHRIRLAPTYGMTETASQVATLKPEDFLQGNVSSGKILPHAKISIQNETGELLDTQQTGKIIIEADSLYLGYYPHLVSEKKSTSFTTDDLGFFDPQGYLHVVGRHSQKIITGGENVFPAEVEAAILATNLVTDVVALGLPDSQWGQVVTAVYVPKNLEVSTTLIREKIKHQLSKYKQPKHWIKVKNLPRNERGKINYQQITELARNFMKKWQIDFYKLPLTDKQQANTWELLICEDRGQIIYEARCPQSQANSDWLVTQLHHAMRENRPNVVQVFRPQALGLVTIAAQKLGIEVEATRNTAALKKELIKRAVSYATSLPNYNPVAVDKPPPQALPENLWGEQWNFASIGAGDLVEMFSDRPIPIKDMPESFLPLNLGIASTTPIPGIVIYGGRNSLRLARWLEREKPVFLNYIPTEVGKSGGLILETGLVDRWILATFEAREVVQAAQSYEQRKRASQGLHFLLVQPDDSGMTYTGFWLLKEEDISH